MQTTTAGQKKKIDSKEAGLVMGLVFGKYFFNTKDMHYGYWPEGLSVNIANLTLAQENHSNLIISNIPAGVKTILDVGCGAGSLAKRLLEKNYSIDCVSPSALLAGEALKVLGNKCGIFESKYEDLRTDKKYDMVIFSESFQYINLPKAIEQSLSFLNPGGHVMICDFFQTDAKGESALGGGHKLKEFYDIIARYPLAKINDTDITKQTAPNIELVDDMLQKVLFPIWTLLFDFIDGRHPFLSKILKWKFKKKIEKINKKYFSGERNAKNFELFKSYRLMLYKKT